MPGYNYSTNASRQITRDPQKQFLLLDVVLTRIAFDMYTTTANQITFKIVCVEQTFVFGEFLMYCTGRPLSPVQKIY